jgi:hypothetical protein
MRKATEESCWISQGDLWPCAKLNFIAVKTKQTVAHFLNPNDFYLYTPSRRPYS